MKKTILSNVIILFLGILFLNFQKPSSPPYNTFIDIDMSVFVPCANSGNGEMVDFSGQLHILIDFTITNNRISAMIHYQPMGLNGVGEISGNQYNATGITQNFFHGSLFNGQIAASFVNNFRMIGVGPGNNFTVHETFHYNFNKNGEVTVEADNFSSDCK